MANNSPVGVLDSGVGGLSILEKIHRLLPAEHLLYVADSAHAPYGGKSTAFIQARCREIMAFFLGQGVKAVVLACNTATAAAVAELRLLYTLPIVGMEPAVKPAAERSRSGVVGVLATAGTIDSEKFIGLSSRFMDCARIITCPCPGVVELIENPVLDSAALDRLLRRYIQPLVDAGADTLVLGCTHYSLVHDRIASIAGPGITVMDTDFAVARELRRRLTVLDALAGEQQTGMVSFFTSGEASVQSILFERYWGKAADVASLAPQEQAV